MRTVNFTSKISFFYLQLIIHFVLFTSFWITKLFPFQYILYFLSMVSMTEIFVSDPPENCHLTVKKLPKTWHLKKLTNFSTKLPMAILKKWQFLSIFLKKCQVYSNFWQSNDNFPEGQIGSEKYEYERCTRLNGLNKPQVNTSVSSYSY